MPSRLIGLEIESPFRFVWLKYVTGVDLSVHCAKSLLGRYDTRIGPKAAGDYELDESPAGVIYLCGVAKPYRWSANVHAAWAVDPDAFFSFETNGISGVVEGGRQLVIPRPVPRPALAHGEARAYFTCRNWQFAARYGPELPPATP
jgi:hypothetical protein